MIKDNKKALGRLTGYKKAPKGFSEIEPTL